MSPGKRLEGLRAPFLFLLATTLLFSAELVAEETVELASLETCANLETSELKLACYDAIVETGKSTEKRLPTPPQKDFGREQLVVPDQDGQKKFISATVVDVTRGYNRSLYFHLANGHVWRQIEPRHFQYPKQGDFEVRISQGVMSEYRLRIGDNGRMIRIRRVQ